MRVWPKLRWAIWVLLPLWMIVGTPAWGGSEPAKNPGVFERIGNTAKKVGKKIEQGFTKATTKLKKKNIGAKVERKLKKAAKQTGEGFKKAGRKIDEKLNR